MLRKLLANFVFNSMLLLVSLNNRNQNADAQAQTLLITVTPTTTTTTLKPPTSSITHTNSMQATVINDYCNAFKMLTNESVILQKIIPEMYNFKNLTNLQTNFTFKLPNYAKKNNYYHNDKNIYDNDYGNKDNGNSFEMLIMKRSDFMDPVFPNLSIAYAASNEITANVRVGNNKFNSKNNNEWSVLGLNGWLGELTKPTTQLEELHRNDNEGSYPRDSIITDLLKGNVDGNINDITSFIGLKRAEDVMDSKDVYIGRANDPFGFSTKWEFRNITNAVVPARPKRGVIKLYSMIKCSTNCEPLTYKGYGCYCGFLGNGRAVDDIDRCCKIHDKCYEHSNCISFLQYFVPYIWKCYRGKPLCAVDHGEWGGPQSCAARLCSCDLRLARCLRQFTCPRKRAVCTSSVSRRFQNLIYFL